MRAERRHWCYDYCLWDLRQAYGFQLDEKKLEELEGIFEKTWKSFSIEIERFCHFLG
jgi:hypothetical protein